VNRGMKSRGRERPGVRMVGPDGQNIRRGRWWVEWRLADGGFRGVGEVFVLFLDFRLYGGVGWNESSVMMMHLTSS